MNLSAFVAHKHWALFACGFFVLVMLATLWNILENQKQKQFVVQDRVQKQRVCQSISPEDTIFVSIASYRDPECHETVFDCLEKSACPLRVHVGVCQQNYEVDLDVMEGYKRLAKKRGTGNYSEQIRVLRMDAGQARGPTYARSLIEQKLFQGERFYLIVDSHMLFTEGWDVQLISMLKQCPSVKSVITMYPADFTRRPSPKQRRRAQKVQKPSFLRFKKFHERTGMVEIEGPVFDNMPTTPQPSLFWAGCCSFSYSNMIQEVPYDPLLPYVFIGEEISMAARLYTHGFDLYTPTSMVMFHRWQRLRPTFWELFSSTGDVHRHRQSLEEQGYRRLRHLFGLQPLLDTDPPLGPYGLGKTRSLADFQRFCGVDLLLQTVSKQSRWGVSPTASQQELFFKIGSVQ